MRSRYIQRQPGWLAGGRAGQTDGTGRQAGKRHREALGWAALPAIALHVLTCGVRPRVCVRCEDRGRRRRRSSSALSGSWEMAAETVKAEGLPARDAPLTEGARRRLIIEKLVTQNFKSYAEIQTIGPFHEVRRRSLRAARCALRAARCSLRAARCTVACCTSCGLTVPCTVHRAYRRRTFRRSWGRTEAGSPTSSMRCCSFSASVLSRSACPRCARVPLAIPDAPWQGEPLADRVWRCRVRRFPS